LDELLEKYEEIPTEDEIEKVQIEARLEDLEISADVEQNIGKKIGKEKEEVKL
jgi:tetrahydromethanopterin S-methyltransferase subunit G